jgi:CHAT domain-containing protein/tetratricopeptide (TPR) repeat protein
LRTMRKGNDRALIGTAILAAVAVAAWMTYCQPESPGPASPIQRLVQAAPRSDRRLEARFCGGFGWAPFRDPKSARPSEEEWDLEGVTGQILSDSERTGNVDTLHATGVARALLGSLEESATRLEAVCRFRPRDAVAWNDLGAARYARAMDEDDPERLPSALSAIDRSLQLSPSLPEARFNRALILMRLGMRNEATNAWRDALAVERDHVWAGEANRHLRALGDAVARPVRPELDRALHSAERGDPKPLRAVVAAHPQETRTIAETIMLTSWAEAVDQGQATEAEQFLERARRIGELLVTINGDRLVSDAVQTIATASVITRRQLAKAHLAYRNGRVHYGKRLPDSAEELGQAAGMFARAGSPMEHVARYYGANAAFDSSRVEHARRALDRVLAAVDSARYPSLAAGAERQLALYYGFRGMWTASLAHFERSRALFSTRGERVNAAFVEGITGEAYDRIGDFDRAWRNRVAALDTLARSPPDHRSLTILVGAVHAEIMRADYESALSLLHLALQEAERVGIPDLTAETLLREARVLLIAHGEQEAERALGKAKAVAASIQNEGTRGRIEAEIAAVEAAIVHRTDPRRAVEIVTPAIAYFRSHGLGILLPPAYLERGRSYLALGARAEARADFENGLRWIEHQRANVAADIRTTLFDTVPDLTGELVDLLLASPDQQAAYAIVERARARTLIEALGVTETPGSVSVPRVAAALPPNGVLIEYALLPQDVAAFCISPKGLTVQRLGVKPAELRRSVTELRALIEDRKSIAEVQKVASELYDDLFLPLEPMIGKATIVYVAPDRFLNAVPFSALYDTRTRQYLIQKARLVLTPSGTFLQRRERLTRRLRPALIIADPTSPAGNKRLDAARREAAELATLFGAAPPLVGHDATIERFIAAAPNSALIVYAGHAHSDDTAGGFLPLAQSHGTDGRMDATAISRLPLRRTSLVILSACATMRGDPSHVEGMPSLSRAFLNASVPAVVGMLWLIDDRTTAQLLAPFHQRLHDGIPPSQALREAQIKMLSSDREELRHPASWAAAELLGVD